MRIAGAGYWPLIGGPINPSMLRPPRATARLLAALGLAALAAPAAAGAGAGATMPRTAETLPAFVARYRATVAALQAGDCAEVRRIGTGTGYEECTAADRARLAGFRVLTYRRFGTGAIIDQQISYEGDPVVASTELGLGPDGRLRSAGVAIFGAGAGIRQVGTRARPRVVFLARRTANLLVRSLRTRDCDLYFTTAYIQEPTKARACANVFGPPRGAPSNGRRLRFALLADHRARPVRIGGTRDIQFFGLVVERRHWTLIVDRSGNPRTGVYITSLVPG
jgi:hypothetical protein